MSGEESDNKINLVSFSELISEVYTYGRLNWRQILKLTVIPVLIYTGVIVGGHVLTIEYYSIELLFYIIEYIPLAIFAVALHRRYLLEEEAWVGLGDREIRYIAYAIFIAIIPQIIIFLSDNLTSQDVFPSPKLISNLIFLYISIRLSLVFPIAAVDFSGRISDHFRLSWSKLSHNVGAMFGVLFFSVLIYVVISYGLEFMYDLSQQGTETNLLKFTLFELVDNIFFILASGCDVIAVSYTFKKLVLSRMPTHS